MTGASSGLTVAEAAAALAVSERTVWRYLKSGRLTGETVGPPGSQRTLIPEEAVTRLRGGRDAAEAEALPPARAVPEQLRADLATAQAARDALAARAAELEPLALELAVVRDERDALRIRVAELERLLGSGRAPRAEDVARRARALAHQATEWTAALRARRGASARRRAD